MVKTAHSTCTVLTGVIPRAQELEKSKLLLFPDFSEQLTWKQSKFNYNWNVKKSKANFKKLLKPVQIYKFYKSIKKILQ